MNIPNELWTLWQPIEGLKNYYWIESVIDNGVLEIVVSKDSGVAEEQISFVFPGRVYFYSKTYETFNLYLPEKLPTKCDDEFDGPWNFFKVINSSRIKSMGISQDDIDDHQHFAIVDGDWIIEIITDKEPAITFIPNKSKKKKISQQKNTQCNPNHRASDSSYRFVHLREVEAPLTFELYDTKLDQLVEIFIDGLVFFFSKTEIIYQKEELAFVRHQHQISTFVQKLPFFELTESPLLKKISLESGGISDDYKVRHFVWITDYYVIDVVATTEPRNE